MKKTIKELEKLSDRQIAEYYNEVSKRGDGLYFNGNTFYKVVSGKRHDLSQTTLKEVA